MLQFKLFKVYNGEPTLDKLDGKFSNIIQFSDNVIGIPYDYGINGYRKVLEAVKDLPIKQYIMTPEKFFKVLNYSIELGYHVNSLNFLESVPQEHQEIISHYKQKINAETDISKKQSIANKFFNELSWIITDESIDIKDLSLRIKPDSSPIYVEVDIYNNGVLLFDNESIKNQVISLIKNIE
jgi:hypothetical protein